MTLKQTRLTKFKVTGVGRLTKRKVPQKPVLNGIQSRKRARARLNFANKALAKDIRSLALEFVKTGKFTPPKERLLGLERLYDSMRRQKGLSSQGQAIVTYLREYFKLKAYFKTALKPW